MLPFAVVVILFVAYPLVELVRTSLSDVSVANGTFTYKFAGVANYSAALHDQELRHALILTGIFAGSVVIGTVVLGTLLAILVDRSTVLGGVANNVLLWPALIAPVVVSVSFYLIFTPTVGALNRVFASVGLPAQAWLTEPIGAMASVIIVDIWHWTPLVFILVLAALKALDRDLTEAARVDGASESQIYARIILPLLWPTIAAAALIRLIMGIRAFDEFYVLTQGGPGTSTTLVSQYIDELFFSRLQFGYAAAVSTIVILVVALIIALVFVGRLTARIALGRS